MNIKTSKIVKICTEICTFSFETSRSVLDTFDQPPLRRSDIEKKKMSKTLGTGKEGK